MLIALHEVNLNLKNTCNVFLFTIPLTYLEYFATTSNFIYRTNRDYISFLKIQKLVFQY